MNIPIIKFEIEGMRHTISTAMQDYHVQMDACVQQAIAEFCTPENLDSVIRGQAKKAMQYAIEAEVDAFFRHGEGRKAIAEQVKKNLLARESYTPLDDVEVSK